MSHTKQVSLIKKKKKKTLIPVTYAPIKKTWTKINAIKDFVGSRLSSC